MHDRTPVIKIRGIYATALTRFFLDRGAWIADPSSEVVRRFGGADRLLAEEEHDIEIDDREDGHAIRLRGGSEELSRALESLRATFWDAIFRWKEEEVEVEFPASSKAALDDWRQKVIPTVPGHHRLKGFAADLIDLLEKKELVEHPERREAIGRNLLAKLVWERYEPGRVIGIEHVKPDGRIISLRPGRVLDADSKGERLQLRREGFRPGGRYDGIGAAKRAGDYDLCEFHGGRWFYRHRHFRRDDKPLGEYLNINTPVEFYPDRVRYLDLEIDTVAWPGGRTAVIDKQKLAASVTAGRISERLRRHAETTARLLTAGREPPE